MEDLSKAEKRKLNRIKRKEELNIERNEKLSSGKKKKLITYSLILILLVAVVYLFYWKSNLPGKYDDFAKCLNDKGFVMAGTDWCKFCKAQKSLFGKSFEFVDYKNCDIEKSWCDSNNIKSYPSWVMPDGTNSVGVKKLSDLSRLSGCELE